MSTVLAAELGGQSVFWMDDPANATTIGPNGWLFGNILTADWVAFLLEDNGTCQLACVAPQGHPCFSDGNQFCVGGLDEAQNPGCLYCGPATADECADFVQDACYDDGGGVADTTGGGGGAEGDGGVDTTAGEEGAAAPDVSMFTSHPDTTFGTTSYVLDRLGEHVPPNLVAEGICDAWHPEVAVQQWLGDPVFERPAFVQMVEEAELFLGRCDQLRLAVVDDGVLLRNVQPQTLAAELGFADDDIIMGMNGVSATDPVALMVEIMALSQTGGTAEVKYLRGTTTSTLKVVVR